MSSPSPEPRTPRQTRWVDPRGLVTRANVRTVAEPDPQLVASIQAGGLIHPPVVYTDPDSAQLVLVAGHRRTAAAIAAGLDRIEVLVSDQPDETARLALQVSENTNRVGLSTREVSDAVEQMTLLGLPAGQIARAAGLRATQVAAARAVAAATDPARTAIDATPQLTMDQAAQLAAWGDDEDAVTRLLTAAEEGPVAFEHARARIQARHDAAQRRADAAQRWAAAGYQVFDGRDSHDNTPDSAVDLTDLTDAEGRPLATTWRGVHDGHAHCPGRAVLMTSWGDGTEVHELCTDPTTNGHTRRTPPAGSTATSRGSRSTDTGPDRGTVMARNRDWKTATSVRQNHMAALIKAGKFTPELVTAVHTWLLDHRTLDAGEAFHRFTDFPRAGRQASPRYGQPLVDPKAPAHRVTGLLIAAAASAAEETLGKQTWRYTSHPAADWLTLLVAHTGYQLADVERIAVRHTKPTWNPPAAATTAAARKTPTPLAASPARPTRSSIDRAKPAPAGRSAATRGTRTTGRTAGS